MDAAGLREWSDRLRPERELGAGAVAEGAAGPQLSSTAAVCRSPQEHARWVKLPLSTMLPLLLPRLLLCTMLKHVQKKMLLDLRQLGINDAPGLGFGCSSSSLGFDTVLLKPM